MSLIKLRLRTVWFSILVAAVVTGCGGSGESPSAEPSEPPPSGGQNSPPTIQGQPGGAVIAGQQYSFQPSASDADGDTLTFSVTNLPSWASFDASTGKLSGTPTSADVATYENISISVSDGTANASLSAFAIAVMEVAVGGAALSWVAPTENSDGSALSDLSGYEIHYGQSAGNLDQVVTLDNESLTTYVIDNLTAGTWYFAIAAVNGGGVSSVLSNVASKTIN